MKTISELEIGTLVYNKDNDKAVVASSLKFGKYYKTVRESDTTDMDMVFVTDLEY